MARVQGMDEEKGTRKEGNTTDWEKRMCFGSNSRASLCGEKKFTSQSYSSGKLKKKQKADKKFRKIEKHFEKSLNS